MGKCAICGSTREVYSVRIGNENISMCYDCYVNKTIQCAGCGERILIENAVTYEVKMQGRRRANTLYFCSDKCFESCVSVCDICGEKHYNGEMSHYDVRYHDGGVRTIHAGYDCVRDAFRFCELCGCFIPVEDFHEDVSLCDRCYKKTTEPNAEHTIYPYHHKKIMRVFGTDGKDREIRCPSANDILLGLELEIDRDESYYEVEKELLDVFRKELQDHVYHERDGSLCCGFENIIYPHTYEAFFSDKNMDAWRKCLKACDEYGYKSHDTKSCGLHVHISRSAFGNTYDERTENIAKLIYLFDAYYDVLLNRFGRRKGNTRWCKRYCSCLLDGNSNRDRYMYISENNDEYDRYHAINITNEDTIEFRIARGTLKDDTFFATVDFCYKLAEVSKVISWDDAGDLNKWIELADFRQETNEYLTRRGVMNLSF